MNKEINRLQAKELIAEKILSESKCNLDKLKINFPYYDYVDEINEYVTNGHLIGLTQKNKDRIQNNDFYTIEFDYLFQPIYKIYFIDSFERVTNKYLESKLEEFGIELNVIGEVEPTAQCPCCFHYSNCEELNWEICSVCFWEDGGNSPNHMTLKEAQQNFEKYGAMDIGSLNFVDQEGKMKYRKER